MCLGGGLEKKKKPGENTPISENVPAPRTNKTSVGPKGQGNAQRRVTNERWSTPCRPEKKKKTFYTNLQNGNKNGTSTKRTPTNRKWVVQKCSHGIRRTKKTTWVVPRFSKNFNGKLWGFCFLLGEYHWKTGGEKQKKKNMGKTKYKSKRKGQTKKTTGTKKWKREKKRCQ